MIEKQYGIIGKPLSHSLSPVLHNYWFKKNNLKFNYSLIEIEKHQIKEIINKIRTKELYGINVTVPYKQEVIPHLDLIINDSKETSSVNTIYLNNENKVVGENTDVYGFEQSFINKLDSANIMEKSFLILGSGGVTPSLIYALNKKKIKKIFISNRTTQKAKDIKNKFSFVEIIPWERINKKSEEVDVIINATSLGMKNGSEFERLIDKFKPDLVYYDVIYNPLETNMLKNFKDKKIITFNGLEMFLFQGQKSFSLWNKIVPKVDEDLKKIIISSLK
jgi:shikimate dehydrogenase|tara:strand:- start:5073 stop:5903 length:831 start_codon:yes stop_codon:yes gene_type:complete